MISIKTALIFACIIYILLLGFFIADRIDRYFSSVTLEENGKSGDPRAEGKCILEYAGESDNNRVSINETLQNLPVIKIKSPGEIKKYLFARYLIASSSSDFENLTAASVAKKQIKNIAVIAVCNDKRNISLFDTLEVKTIASEQATPEHLASILRVCDGKREGENI